MVSFLGTVVSLHGAVVSLKSTVVSLNGAVVSLNDAVVSLNGAEVSLNGAVVSLLDDLVSLNYATVSLCCAMVMLLFYFQRPPSRDSHTPVSESTVHINSGSSSANIKATIVLAAAVEAGLSYL